MKRRVREKKSGRLLDKLGSGNGERSRPCRFEKHKLECLVSEPSGPRGRRFGNGGGGGLSWEGGGGGGGEGPSSSRAGGDDKGLGAIVSSISRVREAHPESATNTRSAEIGEDDGSRPLSERGLADDCRIRPVKEGRKVGPRLGALRRQLKQGRGQGFVERLHMGRSTGTNSGKTEGGARTGRYVQGKRNAKGVHFHKKTTNAQSTVEQENDSAKVGLP